MSDEYFKWKKDCEDSGFSPDLMWELFDWMTNSPEIQKLVEQAKKECLESTKAIAVLERLKKKY